MVNQVRGLGRGLDALLSSDTNEQQVTILHLDEIVPHKDQPRSRFNQDTLEELARSIKEHGVLQPVIVRSVDGAYELVAGERRWRAAKLAGLNTIPTLIVDINEQEAAEMALIENLQRDDLSVWEEARAYKQFMENFHYTQEQMAEKVGKSRSHVANTLRILTLPEEIQMLVAEGQISAGHARTLLALPEEEQRFLAFEIVKNKLSVRAIEKMVKEKKGRMVHKRSVSDELAGLQDQLQNHFSAKVRILPRKQGGKVEIDYYNEEDLERIVELLSLKFTES